MSTLYRIRDAAKHFENNRTRDVKTMTWIAVPNKHDSDGFTQLMSRPNGLAMYGAWQLILQVASKCNPRWTLVRNGNTPHDAASIARVTRGDVRVFEEAIPVLLEIGWIEVIDDSRDDLRQGRGGDAPDCDDTAVACGGPALTCGNDAGTCPTDRQDKTEQDRTGQAPQQAARSANHFPLKDEFLARWNSVVTFSPIRSITDKRLVALKARAKDPEFRDNWQTAMDRIPLSAFLRGENPRHWKANVDWFLRPDTVTGILEGKYHDEKSDGKAKNLFDTAIIAKLRAFTTAPDFGPVEIQRLFDDGKRFDDLQEQQRRDLIEAYRRKHGG